MNRYKYHVELTMEVVARNEDEAMRMVENQLSFAPDLIDLEDIENVSRDEMIADQLNDERKCR